MVQVRIRRRGMLIANRTTRISAFNQTKRAVLLLRYRATWSDIRLRPCRAEASTADHASLLSLYSVASTISFRSLLHHNFSYYTCPSRKVIYELLLCIFTIPLYFINYLILSCLQRTLKRAVEDIYCVYSYMHKYRRSSRHESCMMMMMITS